MALICTGIIQPLFICQGAPGQVQPEETLELLLGAAGGMLTWLLEQAGLWADPVEVILWFFNGSLCCALDAEQKVLGNGWHWQDGVELLSHPSSPVSMVV